MPNLAVVSQGLLAGHPVVPVDMGRFTNFKQRCLAAHVQYGFGSKDPHPGTGQVDFREIDCSGFARTLLMYACHGVMNTMPDGSALQQEFFAGLKLKASAPADTALSDGLLRICFHLRDDLDGTGHVWFTESGRTTESFGGHGPGEREWNALLHSGHRLNELATHVYVLCPAAGA